MEEIDPLRTNRRTTDNIDSRVSVLEIRVDNNEKILDTMKLHQETFFKKFDEHTTLEMEAHAMLRNALDNLGSKTDVTNDTLKKIEKQSDGTTKDVDKIKTIWFTLTKVALVVSLTVSATWALFTHFSKPKVVEKVEILGWPMP